MSSLVNGYMGEAISEDGKYASYNLNKEHLIAIETIENGYKPIPTDLDTTTKIFQALGRDFKREFHNTYERNRINVYMVHCWLDYFLYLKKNGRESEVHPEVLKLLEKF